MLSYSMYPAVYDQFRCAHGCKTVIVQPGMCRTLACCIRQGAAAEGSGLEWGFTWKHKHMLVSTALHMRREWCFKYSAFTEKLPTRAFLVPLDEDEEIEASLSQGVNV